MKWSNRIFANILGIFLVIGFFSFFYQFGGSSFQPFVKETELESHDNARDVISTPSGGVYTGGSSFSKSNVISWDDEGGLNWEKFIEIIPYWEGETEGYRSTILDMQIDGEGNLYTITYILIPREPCCEQIYLIQKLDENGSEIWKTEIFGEFESAIEPSIILDNDGNLYMIINELRSGFNVMKLDSLGDMVWNNTYTGNTVYTSPSSAAIDDNNSIYIVGFYKEGDGIFLKIDSSGDLVFNNSYEDHLFQGMIIGETDIIYTFGKLNNDESDLSVEFIKWSSDGIPLEYNYWNVSRPNYEISPFLYDMHFSENNKIFAFVTMRYSRPYQRLYEQNFVVLDIQSQTIQNKTIVTVNESDEIWISSFLIDSDNNLYTAGVTNQSVLLSKWDHSFNKIWDKTWSADSRVQLSYPYLENGGGFAYVILAGIIAIYFVSTNLILKKRHNNDLKE